MKILHSKLFQGEYLFHGGSTYLLLNKYWGSSYFPVNNYWGVLFTREYLLTVTPGCGGGVSSTIEGVYGIRWLIYFMYADFENRCYTSWFGSQMTENSAPSWQPHCQSKTIAFCYFVSIYVIEKIFLMKIPLKMCL